MSDEVQDARRLPSLRWILFALVQFAAALSAAVVIHTVLPWNGGVGSLVRDIFVRDIFSGWIAWINSGFAFVGLGDTVASVMLQQIIVVGLLLLIPTIRALFRPGLKLVRDGYSNISSSLSWSVFSGLGRLAGAVVTSFARFVVAPLLFSAVTVNLTWNIHLWMFENYGQTAAIASVLSVFGGTCLLLALGLERLIPR